MTSNVASENRNVAIVGPYLSGKTALLESLLFATGTITRKGTAKEGNRIGDGVAEARDRNMSVEINAAYTQYGGINFTFLDCPGSVEFAQETYNGLMGAGLAIVVCEPEPSRILTLSPLFKFLDDWEIPHIVFINKMDRAFSDEDGCNLNFLELLNALKTVSSRPIVPQEYPIAKGSELIGFIDLVTEQAYNYHPGATSDPVPMPEELKELEHAARQEMLEQLSNFDDHLLEELLEEIEPPTEEIVKDLKMELGADLIVPVFLGAAELEYGVRSLLDALVREAPEPSLTAERRGLKGTSDISIAQVLKTFYTPQGGKLSLVRVWQGELTEGIVLNGVRAAGMYRLLGQQTQSVQLAKTGEIVALARMEGIKTGDTLTTQPDRLKAPLPKAQVLPPVLAFAIAPENRKDEVKLSAALTKMIEEDPSLTWEQNTDTHQVILWGQGEIHLKVTLDRLRRKYNFPIVTSPPQIPYKETIRSNTNSHGRYKHQSGGHGQFGDVYLDITPLPRGEGFNFNETIVGGAVPKQYIPGVEMGVREYLEQGPLGFPVVDVSVTLTNGSYHSVDSSEQAFKQAARLAMQTGMAKCNPTLLEPIVTVEVCAPNEFTSQLFQLITTRRGQILGYEPVADWKGWDQVSAYLPQVEMQDLIVELRSLTMGVGYFNWKFDHLQEVPEQLAQRVLATVADQSNGGGNSKSKN
ncbi:MAG: elongation factor G [Arthrospira sp. SH-MAG29]|nr:elongation factor G [Arthrospira sp. SH-MAG29]MBS0014772.1 elongation factor G [Arthrospira sp. SH-MAG29]